MPDDVSLQRGASRALHWGEILDTLRIKMNFATVISGEPFQQFSQCTFGAVAAVHERRNDSQPQVSASVVDRVASERGG